MAAILYGRMHLKFPLDEVCVGEQATIKETIVAIDRHGLGFVLVTGAGGLLLGIVTDGDVRRALIRGADILGPVSGVTNRSPITAPWRTPVPTLLRLVNDRIRHVPLVDARGAVRDIFSYEHRHRLPVAEPLLGDEEMEAVTTCLLSGWISSGGPFVTRFEEEFARFAGARHAVACCNGTAALHLIYAALGIGPGDEVIVPTLTFVATASAVMFTGARPVFVDVDPHTWTMDPAAVEAAITPRTRAIVPVHLYGHPADVDALSALAAPRGIAVVEDAAEAHGARYRGRPVGSLGRAAAFSFFGNKIVTTGEGGMVTTDDDALADQARILRDHGMRPTRRYWHEVVGFNYRMTNLQAAVGVAQLGKVQAILAAKRNTAERYRMHLEMTPGLAMQPRAPWAEPVCWLFTMLVEEGFPLDRDGLIAALAGRGIDTRPVFHPLHRMPPYAPKPGERERAFPVSEEISRRGLTLPSGVGLADAEIDRVAFEIRALAR
ncbi:MAG: aminotransferase class I/II-fold pyridoxal phosphate-dependent enzyme [Planctomycetes bacterium]|nr:aminotransferase class I/II-fold pyridoxal phosphate-dependent enzyme [Planctomycetota bacterium]